MKITLLVVGKTTDPHLQALIDDYRQRLTHYLPFSLQVMPELRNTKALTEDQQKQAEGSLILGAVSASARLILLDEHGRQYRSVAFAAQLQKWMQAGQDIVCVIGGPYGFSQQVYDRADILLSLSEMTFSHQMVRLFFVEQLYRACTIINHQPYHHE